MTAPIHPTLSKVKDLVRSLGELTPEMEVRAQLCFSLALRIDKIETSTTGAQSMALPQLIKQLGTCIEELIALKPYEDEFLDYLNNSYDDETKEEYAARKHGAT
jgi:hypothetical protein